MSKGQVIFAIVFFIAFVIGIGWAYSKDNAYTRFHFKKTYKILLGIIILFSILFLYVKFRTK